MSERKYKLDNKGKATLFKNGILEALTKTHPALIIAMYVPLSGYFLYIFYKDIEPSFSKLIGLFFLGVFIWTFIEYIMHRFVFHFVVKNPVVKRIHYFIHGVHHDYPRDKNRLVMPPIPSIIVAVAFFFFFKLFLNDYIYAFFAGFLIGYLIYAMMHYAMHAMAPPFPFLKNLWAHHALHHYKDDHKGYGVSSPLWDHIFGTTFKEEDANTTQ